MPLRGLYISLVSTEKHNNLCLFHHTYETNITICQCLIIYQRHSVLQHNTALRTTTELSIHMVKRLSCHKIWHIGGWKSNQPPLSGLTRQIYYGT